MSWLFFLLGCRENDPVLAGIPSEPLLEERTSAADSRKTPRENSKTKARHYQKPPGVIVDVQGFGGASFREVQPHLVEQLGAFVRKYTLSPKDGERRIYERGEVRLVRDTIYMIHFTLPEPVRRSDALRAAGFLEQVDKYLITHHEYQVLYEYEFVRFRMKRVDSESELVKSFEGWKWVPMDQAAR